MATVALGTFLGIIDSSIVNIALPTLVKEYTTSFAKTQWVVCVVYLLAVTILMLGIGLQTDILRKKSVSLNNKRGRLAGRHRLCLLGRKRN